MQKEDTSHYNLSVNMLEYGALMTAALLLGSVYALWTKEKSGEVMSILCAYLKNESSGLVLSELLLKSYWNYLTKLSLVFALSYLKFGTGINYIIISGIIFSYGYTSADYIMLYGIQGALVNFILCGMTGSIMLLMMFYIQYARKKNFYTVHTGKKAAQWIGSVVAVSILLAAIQTLIYTEKLYIIKFILRD